MNMRLENPELCHFFNNERNVVGREGRFWKNG